MLHNTKHMPQEDCQKWFYNIGETNEPKILEDQK